MSRKPSSEGVSSKIQESGGWFDPSYCGYRGLEVLQYDERNGKTRSRQQVLSLAPFGKTVRILFFGNRNECHRRFKSLEGWFDPPYCEYKGSRCYNVMKGVEKIGLDNKFRHWLIS
ncbi:hypothetical protein CEXT_599741 [Caerostris extrusa]|uniref:Uncharacterized protein n=1 Tax=Caerostris extrusa TaxID=172846 RepID=A0AAV4RPL1_CAEEX|nr:hypothetical protein CEXT_599741 [Caerostris extrusa]